MLCEPLILSWSVLVTFGPKVLLVFGSFNLQSRHVVNEHKYIFTTSPLDKIHFDDHRLSFKLSTTKRS